MHKYISYQYIRGQPQNKVTLLSGCGYIFESTLESAKKVCIQSCRIRRVGTFLVASEEVLKNRAVTKAKL